MTRRASTACALPCWRWATRRTRSSAPTGKAIDARLEALGGNARRRPRRPRPRLRQAGGRVDREARWASSRRPRPPAPRRSCTSTSRAARSPPMTTSRSSPPRTRSKARSRRSSISTAPARRARPGTSSSPPTRRASPICRATPSASLPENDPALALELAEAVGLGADGGVVAEAARELRRDDAVARAGRGLRQAHRPQRRGQARRCRRPLPSSRPTGSSSICSRPIPRSSTPEQLFGLLRPLPGRLYSVASSLKAHPGEAHLLVGAVRWESHGKKRKGVASTYLADRRKHRRHGAHLRQAEPPLPPARGRRRARSS